MISAAEKERLNMEKLNSPSFELPLFDSRPPVIKLGLFKWSLKPINPAEPKRVTLVCTECGSTYNHGWPIRSTNLRSHWITNHGAQYNYLMRMAEASTLPRDQTTLSSTPLSEVDTSTPDITSFFGRNQNDHRRALGGSNSYDMPKSAPHADFDPGLWIQYYWEFLVANNLAFALVDSESLKRLLNYTKRCENEDLPQVSRHTMRKGLDYVYKTSVTALKHRLANFRGRFAITLDEWKASNNFDFFAVTLHFHNNDFVMENHTIGFEVLNGENSFTGKGLFQHLERVLDEYGIKHRLISITRNNAGPINKLLEAYTENFKANMSGLKFEGDITCVGHVFNLATGAFLDHVFFKTNTTEQFKEFVRALETDDPDIEPLLCLMKQTPEIVKSTIRGVRNNHYLKGEFKLLVTREREKAANGPVDLLRDNVTRWLSTFKMIDRFIHFRKEVTELLRKASVEPTTQRDHFELATFEIDDFHWKHLADIREILEAFIQPTLSLQGASYETINLTIPYVCTLLEELKNFRSSNLERENPLLESGIKAMRDKLLSYYPVHSDDIEPLKTLYVATVLDPRLKLDFFRDYGFSTLVVKAIEDHFIKVYRRYRREDEESANSPNNPAKRRHTNTPDTPSVNTSRYRFFGKPTIASIDEEVARYLSDEPDCEEFCMQRYYQARKEVFPTIYRMAKDYLSIIAMSSPADQLFSKIKNSVTDKRNRLSPGAIKEIAILKSNGIVKDEDTLLIDTLKDLTIEVNDSEMSSTPDVGEVDETLRTGVYAEIDCDDDVQFSSLR